MLSPVKEYRQESAKGCGPGQVAQTEQAHLCSPWDVRLAATGSIYGRSSESSHDTILDPVLLLSDHREDAKFKTWNRICYSVPAWCQKTESDSREVGRQKATGLGYWVRL